MTVRVFISYRRDDSRHLAGRLRDQLVVAFGAENAFFDVDSIPFGMDFRRVIGDRVAAVHVVLALIGPRYAPEQLAQANDMVRMELTTAFEQRKLVVPVLLEGAPIPAADELPDDLEQLAYLHAAPLRPDPDFHPDTQRFIGSLTTTLADARDQPPAPTDPPPGPVEPPIPSRSTPAPPCDRRVAPRRWTLIDKKGGWEALAIAFSLWDPDSGDRTLSIEAGGAYGVGFLADGNTVVSLDGGGDLRTWRRATGEAVLTIPAHSQGGALACWPTGPLIATGGGTNDPTVRLWDPATGTPIATLSGHGGRIHSLAFSPDGHLLASAGSGEFFRGDNQIRMWSLDP